MNNPEITIVTVTYNAVSTLEKTILSVINQTYPNIEYIIIDGGSTDGTVDIIKKYENRLAYWVSEPDKGIYDAMNKGIIKATGEWINFMNAGDWLINEKTIEAFVDLHDTNADIIYGDTEYRIARLNVSYIKKVTTIESIESGMFFCHQSTFVKAELMKDTFFDTTFTISADYNFFLHCYRNNKIFRYIPIPIAVFDLGTGISSNFKISRHEDARIHGIKHKISWKAKYVIEYIIWKLRHWMKNNLPQSMVKKYYLRRNK